MLIDVDAANSLITASEAARYAEVSIKTICTWATRGYVVDNGFDDKGRKMTERKFLPIAGKNGRGQSLYHFLDVARAEAATRERARRTYYPSAA